MKTPNASGDARAITAGMFESVRRRAALAAGCRLVAHAAFGAAFGTVLARTGGAPPWSMALLGVAGAVASTLWTTARLPRIDAGRTLERRFPESRNVLITADEVLTGALDVTDDAAVRVFDRAAETLARIDARRAVGLTGPLVFSVLSVAASGLVIAWAWAGTPSVRWMPWTP